MPQHSFRGSNPTLPQSIDKLSHERPSFLSFISNICPKLQYLFLFNTFISNCWPRKLSYSQPKKVIVIGLLHSLSIM